jgi:hypothetical protein
LKKKSTDGTVADLILDLLREESTATPAGSTNRDQADRNPTASPGVEPSSSPTRDRVNLLTPPLKPVPDEQTKGWFVGIDLGTTGLSVVLMNPATEQFYPLYWTIASDANPSTSEGESPVRRFRLPAIAAFPAPSGDRAPEPSSPQARLSIPIAITDRTDRFRNLGHDADLSSPVFVQHIKPYLRLGIPYRSPQTQQWEPVLQWSDHQQLPLAWLQSAFQTLLLTLKHPTRTAIGTLRCSALGLSDQSLQNALHQLAGVVIGYPANWSDTYSFNLREGILQAGLVAQPDQIFFLEDTIATLLSVLQRRSDSGQAGQAGQAGQNSASPDPGIVLQNADWQGRTLVLNAGATMTEFMLVDLPAQLDTLTHADFLHRSLPFAGNAIDQDIVCQWLYPLLQQPAAHRTRHLDRIDLTLPAVDWSALNLHTLTLPAVGEPDLPNRYRLHQRLEAAPAGQILLEAARHLKIAFQQQSYFTLQLGDRTWTLLRQDLGSRVLLPYVQRLNRELNTLLKQAEVTAPEISQVICTGGTASMGAIARWLRQKLPNAVIIQDTYTRPTVPQDNCIFSCSRVAYGLAVLPLCANLLNVARHQCNDYFLLLELLRHFPKQPASARRILQTLEQSGVDAVVCQSHLLALLEGHLPPGLMPSERDLALFAPDSLQNPYLQAIQSAPLLQKRGSHYHPNPQQQQQLQQFLDMILAQSRQTLTHPYTALPHTLISHS